MESDDALLLRLGSPASVRIDDLRIDAPVIPVGLVDGNVLEIPKDIQRVGWYEYGPRPGSPAGSSVLVAHRDGTTQGRGVFFALDALDVGARVEVVTSTGLTLPYRVVAVEGIQKAKFQADIEEFFASDGPPRLTLITCGGAYEPGQGGYQANVIVTAVPVVPGSAGGG
ncbi:MAG: class F sortase [Actinomycetales bacterium]|nr:class F sortase [Actinomycetales bacterium]